MIFPPAFLDSSSCWNTNHNNQLQQLANGSDHLTSSSPSAAAAAGGNGNNQLGHQEGGGLQVMAPTAAGAGGDEAAINNNSSSKAMSMSERARLARVPQPEPGLNCPRCDSTNTKFCYFNNYSLSQPRHFCKACRRYWTRGGALRNVPVGGGCRRNKRSSKSSKSSSSSSAAACGVAAGVNTSSSSSATTSSATTGSGIMPALGQMPFFAASLVSGSGGGEGQYGVGGGGGLLAGVSRSLGFPGGLMGPMGSQQLDSAVENYHHQLGGGMGGSMEQWRLPPPQMQMQQFPFFGGGRGAGPDAMSGMQQLQQQMQAGISNYPFEPDAGDGSGEGFAAGQMMGGGGGGGKQVVPGSAGLITQLASVKMEDNPPTAMAREFLGLPAAGSLQFWAGGSGGNNGVSGGGAGAPGGGSGGWVDRLAGFNSSSSGNIL